MNNYIFSCVLARKGGDWLGNVRRRIQTMFKNGEYVTWGSNDKLEPQATVSNVGELASEAAAGALNEYNKMLFMDRYITKHFTVSFDDYSWDDKGTKKGEISWMNHNFAQFWYCPTDGYGENSFKWVLNRARVCIEMDYHDPQPNYKDLHEMLNLLEDTFPHKEAMKKLWAKGIISGRFLHNDRYPF